MNIERVFLGTAGVIQLKFVDLSSYSSLLNSGFQIYKKREFISVDNQHHSKKNLCTAKVN